MHTTVHLQWRGLLSSKLCTTLTITLPRCVMITLLMFCCMLRVVVTCGTYCVTSAAHMQGLTICTEPTELATLLIGSGIRTANKS